MSTVPLSTSAPGRSNPVLAVTAPLVVAYASTCLWIWSMWWFEDSYYQHGPLLVAAAAWGVWDRRSTWRALPARADGRAWWLLGPALFAHLAAVGLTIDSLSALSLLVAVPAAAWLAVGAARTREVLSALMALAFAVPPPLRITGEFVFWLKEVAMGAALRVANLFGEIVVRDGHLLRVTLAAPSDPASPYGWLRVADECGGLRSLLALTAVGYCLAFLFGPRRGARPWVLLLLAGPVAVAANVLRIAGLCWAERWGWDAGVAHDAMNVLEWVFALGLLVAVDLLWLRRGGRT